MISLTPATGKFQQKKIWGPHNLRLFNHTTYYVSGNNNWLRVDRNDVAVGNTYVLFIAPHSFRSRTLSRFTHTSTRQRTISLRENQILACHNHVRVSHGHPYKFHNQRNPSKYSSRKVKATPRPWFFLVKGADGTLESLNELTHLCFP